MADSGKSLQNTPDQDAILAVFDAYKRAVLNNDGRAALKVASRRMIEYYDRMRQAALFMPAAEVQELPILDRLTTLILRMRLTADDLLRMSAPGLFIHAINESWTGKQGAVRADLGDIEVDGGYASCPVGEHGIVRVSFWCEGGEWRIDLTPAMETGSAMLAARTANSPDTEEQRLFQMLDGLGISEPTPELYEPLVPPEEDAAED